MTLLATRILYVSLYFGKEGSKLDRPTVNILIRKLNGT